MNHSSNSTNPNFKHEIRPGDFLKKNRYSAVLYNDEEIQQMDLHLQDAVCRLTLPDYAKRLLLVLNDEGHDLVSDVPLSHFADPFSIEWTEFEEKKKSFTATVLPLVRSIFLHQIGVENNEEMTKYDTIQTTCLKDEGHNELEDDLSCVSHLIRQHRVLVHIWKSAKAANHFVEGWKTVWQCIGEYRLNALAAPISCLAVFESRFVSITWLPPIFRTVNAITSDTNEMIPFHQLRQLFGVMGIRFAENCPLSPSLYVGYDGRVYLLSLYHLLCKPFAQLYPMVRCRREFQKDIRRQLKSEEGKGISSWDDALMRLKVPALVATLIKDAESLKGNSADDVAQQLVRDRQRGISQRFHQYGVNMCCLYPVYARALSEWNTRKQRSEEVKNSSDLRPLDGLLLLLEGHMAVRTLKDILRFEFCSTEWISKAHQNNKQNSGEHNHAAVFFYHVEIVNCLLKLTLLADPSFWTDHLMPVMRRKFSTPIDFVFDRVTEREDSSSRLHRGICLYLLIQQLPTVAYQQEVGRFTRVTCPGSVIFIGPKVPCWSVPILENPLTFYYLGHVRQALFDPTGGDAHDLRCAVVSYNVLSAAALLVQSDTKTSDRPENEAGSLFINQPFHESFLVVCIKVFSVGSNTDWKKVEVIQLLRLYSEIQAMLLNRDKAASFSDDQRDEFREIVQCSPDKIGCYQAYLTLHLGLLPMISIPFVSLSFQFLFYVQEKEISLIVSSDGAATEGTLFLLSKMFAQALTSCQKQFSSFLKTNEQGNISQNCTNTSYQQLLECEWRFIHRAHYTKVAALILKQTDAAVKLLLASERKDEARRYMHIAHRGLAAVFEPVHEQSLLIALKILQLIPAAGFDGSGQISSVQEYARALSTSSVKLKSFLEKLFQFRHFSPSHLEILELMQRNKVVAEWVREWEKHDQGRPENKSALCREDSSSFSAEIVMNEHPPTKGGRSATPSAVETVLKSNATVISEGEGSRTQSQTKVVSATTVTAPKQKNVAKKFSSGDLKVSFSFFSPTVSDAGSSPVASSHRGLKRVDTLTNLLIEASSSSFSTKLFVNDETEFFELSDQIFMNTELVAEAEEDHRRMLEQGAFFRRNLWMWNMVVVHQRGVALREVMMTKKFMFLESVEPIARDIVVSDEMYYTKILQSIYFDDVDTRRRIIAHEDSEWRQLTTQILLVSRSFLPEPIVKSVSSSEKIFGGGKRSHAASNTLQASPTSSLNRFLRSETFALLLAHERLGIKLLLQTQHDYLCVFSYVLVLEENETACRMMVQHLELLARVETDVEIVTLFITGLEAVERENLHYVFRRVREVIELGLASPMVRRRMLSALPPSGADLVNWLQIIDSSSPKKSAQKCYSPSTLHSRRTLHLSPNSCFAERIGARAFSRLNAALLWRDAFGTRGENANVAISSSVVEDSLLLSAAVSPDGFLSLAAESEEALEGKTFTPSPLKVSALRMQQSNVEGAEEESISSSGRAELSSYQHQRKMHSFLSVIQNRRALAEDVVAAFINVANLFSSEGTSEATVSHLTSQSLKAEMVMTKHHVDAMEDEGRRLGEVRGETDPMPIISQIGNMLLGVNKTPQGKKNSNIAVDEKESLPQLVEDERNALRTYYYKEMSLEIMNGDETLTPRHHCIKNISSTLSPQSCLTDGSNELDLSSALILLLHRTGREAVEREEEKIRTIIYTKFLKEQRQRFTLPPSVIIFRRLTKEVIEEEVIQRGMLAEEDERERFSLNAFMEIGLAFQNAAAEIRKFHVLFDVEAQCIHDVFLMQESSLFLQRVSLIGHDLCLIYAQEISLLANWFSSYLSCVIKAELHARQRIEVIFRKEMRFVLQRSVEVHHFFEHRLVDVQVQESIERKACMNFVASQIKLLILEMVCQDEVFQRRLMSRKEEQWRKYHVIQYWDEPFERRQIWLQFGIVQHRWMLHKKYYLEAQLFPIADELLVVATQWKFFGLEESTRQVTVVLQEAREFRSIIIHIKKEVKQRGKAELLFTLKRIQRQRLPELEAVVGQLYQQGRVAQLVLFEEAVRHIWIVAEAREFRCVAALILKELRQRKRVVSS